MRKYVTISGTTRLIRRQLPGSTETAASFEVIDEGHTLGNALRFVVMKKYDGPHTQSSHCLLTVFQP